MKSYVAGLILTGLAALPAHAAMVYTQSFDTSAAGWSTNESTGTATTGFSGADGNPAGSLLLNDMDVAGSSKTSMGSNSSFFSTFNTSQAGQETMLISFDLKVTSFLTTNSSRAARLILYSSTLNSNLLNIGFGTTGLTASDKNVLFAATGTTGPSLSNAFGGGTGAWDFGNYDSGNGANNDTNGFIHLQISYTNQTNQAVVTASYGSNTASLTLTGLPLATYGKPSGSGVQNFFMIAQTGPEATSIAYFDNVQVQTVPEPSVSVLLGLAGMALCSLRGRRRV